MSSLTDYYQYDITETLDISDILAEFRFQLGEY